MRAVLFANATGHRGLLRARGERPRRRWSAEQDHELTSPHVSSPHWDE
jgi:hypothetical protein